jgi:integrase
MAHLFKRGRIFYLKYYVAGKQKEISLRTDVHQIAKEKQRRFESGQAAGNDNPLPTRTLIGDLLNAYVQHIRVVKTPKSAQNDIYYLREAFGEVCPALKITSRTPSAAARKRPSKTSKADRRRKMPVIEANAFEEITVSQVASFIDFKVRDQGLKPKTANHYRSIIRRVFNWATEHHGIRLPNNTNPAAKVRPYKEQAPEIRFLTLKQIDEQLEALRFKPHLQTMVAVLIYAGLRREELLWLTVDDIDLHRRNGGHGLLRIRAKTIDGRYWQPKTKRNRAVPISRSLREYLSRWTVRASDHGWFFPSPDGTWWDPDNFSADLRDANHAECLPWSCLDFRHTLGSLLAQRGVSLYKIATLMGNSPEICRRHYAALTDESMVDDVWLSISDQTLRVTAHD